MFDDDEGRTSLSLFFFSCFFFYHYSCGIMFPSLEPHLLSVYFGFLCKAVNTEREGSKQATFVVLVLLLTLEKKPKKNLHNIPFMPKKKEQKKE